jgi:hypothetical protein
LPFALQSDYVETDDIIGWWKIWKYYME